MTKAILLACGVSTALSGCMPSVLQYDRGNPVVMSSLQQGATRESVLSAVVLMVELDGDHTDEAVRFLRHLNAPVVVSAADPVDLP